MKGNDTYNCKFDITPICNGYYKVCCTIHDNIIGIFCERKNPTNPLPVQEIKLGDKTLYYFSTEELFLMVSN